MRIVALDPGTHCGWAVYNSNSGVLKSGSFDLKIHSDESAEMRLLRLHTSLDRFRQPVDLLIFEANKDSRFSKAVRIHGQIEAAIMLWASKRDPKIPFQGVNPSSVLKWLCGKKYIKQLRAWAIYNKSHQLPKPHMKELKTHYMWKKYGYRAVDDHDRMDAEAVLRFYLAVEAPKIGLHVQMESSHE